MHGSDRSITILGYPEAAFPPTDFHTATHIGNWIYIIGGLGYADRRAYGTTPVHRLHTRHFHIEPVECSGDSPGWIHRHTAVAKEALILLRGGTILSLLDGAEIETENETEFTFDPATNHWTRR